MISKRIILVFLIGAMIIYQLQSQNRSQELFDSLNSLSPKEIPSYEEIIFHLNRIHDLAKDEEDLKLQIRAKMILGSFYIENRDLYNFQKSVLSSLELSVSLDSNSQMKGSIFNNLALLQSIKGNYSESIKNYFKSLEIEKMQEFEPYDLAIIYFNLGNGHYVVGDVEQSERFLKIGIDLLKPAHYIDSNVAVSDIDQLLVKSLSSLAKIHLRKKEFNSAKFLILKALEKNHGLIFEKSNFEIDLIQRLGLANLGLKNLSSVLDNLKSAKTLNESNPYRKHRTYRLYGKYYQALKEYEKAKEHFDISLELATEDYETDKEFAFIPLIHDNIGDLYLEQDSLDKALQAFHEGLQFFDDALSSDLNLNPTFKNYTEFPEALSLLQKKSQTAKRVYIENGDASKKEVAINAYMATVGLLDQMRRSYLVDGSKFFVAEKAYPIYTETIEFLYHCYQMEPTEELLNKIFAVIEKNKSSILFESIENKFNLLSSSLPEELIEKESDLTSSVSYYSKLLSEEKLKDDGDSLRILEYENAVFESQEQLTILNSKLKSEYPEYFDYKNDLTSSIQIEEIKNLLDHNDLVLEYFASPSDLYVFAIDKSRAAFKKCKLDKELLKNYIELISKAPSNDQDPNLLNAMGVDLALSCDFNPLMGECSIYPKPNFKLFFR